jgi:hypothetical protein
MNILLNQFLKYSRYNKKFQISIKFPRTPMSFKIILKIVNYKDPSLLVIEILIKTIFKIKNIQNNKKINKI